MTEHAGGRLSVVGTGIRFAGQLTTEARNLIVNADRVYAAMADNFSLAWLRELNPRLSSLQSHYQKGRQRDQSYRGMVDEVLAAVRQGQRVCAAFYGHPGVFVWPSHAMIEQARQEGYPAQMYPAVSAEDCLFADLGFDPARSGCQSYEAMDFLLYERMIEPTAGLILWQIAALGDYTRSTFRTNQQWVEELVQYLLRWYPEDHPVTIYQAAILPVDDTRIETLPLSQLGTVELHPTSTLFIPPAKAPGISRARLRNLGLTEKDLAPGGYQIDRDRND